MNATDQRMSIESAWHAAQIAEVSASFSRSAGLDLARGAHYEALARGAFEALVLVMGDREACHELVGVRLDQLDGISYF